MFQSLDCDSTHSSDVIVEHPVLQYLSVQNTSKISKHELDYVNERYKKTKDALKKLLPKGTNIKNVPKIAFVCSGGGYRAAIGSLGYIMAAQKKGLLDAVTYCVCSSGSSWFYIPWLYSEISDLKKFRQKFITIAAHDSLIEITPKKVQELIIKLFERFKKKQPISIIDFYGALLEHEFLHLREHKSSPSLNDLMQTKLLKQFQAPFPIVTGLLVKNTSAKNYSREIEFTPTDVYIPELAVTISSIAFGARHNQGKPISPYYNNDRLGFIMGITSSIFSATIREFTEQLLLTKPLYKEFFTNLLEQFPSVENSRILSTAKVYNFMYDLPEFEKKTHDSISPKVTTQELNEISKLETLQMVDPGILNNLPIAPVLRPERSADIVFIFDFSSDSTTKYVNTGLQLRLAEQYAREHDLPFPEIDYKDIDKKLVSVFKPTKPVDRKGRKIPTIVYIPLQFNEKYKYKNKEFKADMGTTQLKYSKDEVLGITGLAMFNFDEIWSTIQQVLLDHVK